MKPIWREPEVARRRTVGRFLAKLILLTFVFCGFLDSSLSQLPISTGAPHVGQKLPDFTLPDQNGKPVSLADLSREGPQGKSTGLVLIFYRGYW